MKLSEGTVFGEKYYTVDPDIKAYEPFWYHQDWHDMENWCKKTFGQPGSVWEVNELKTPLIAHRWYMNNSKFWFREKKDLEWFVLKWT